jgi:hypothetical protein
MVKHAQMLGDRAAVQSRSAVDVRFVMQNDIQQLWISRWPLYLLADLRHDWLGPTFLAKIRQQKKGSRRYRTARRM